MSGTVSRFRSRAGAAQAASVGLMIGAFVSFGGFMYWLKVNTSPTELQVSEDISATAGISSVLVGADNFAENPSAYLGQTVEVGNLPVSDVLGNYLFFVNLPGDVPFLVKTNARQVDEEGFSTTTGSVVTIVGEVRAMDEAILDGWVAQGWLAEADRVFAEFAVTFLDALVVDGGSGMAPNN